MPATERIRAALRPLMGASHLIKLSDVINKLGLPPHDCIETLEELVNAGELRRTCNKDGEPYYWFVGADREPGGCG